ncbi:MAG TPA: DEAD/DEAH box helicase, partial [Pseudomonadota bacterium]|nr:DEAD/DEAH box helicase [Pseudomonadota bacterium]
MNEQGQASQSAEALAGQAGAERAPATTTNEVPPAAESQEQAALIVAPTVAITVAPSAALTVVPGAAEAGAEGAGASPAVLSEADYGPAPQTFAEMGLAEDVLQSLLAMGFSEPLQVQRRVYRPIMAGRDLIVQSRTGSGKTAAFGIPFVQALIDPAADVKNGHPQALVLGPTRELALQVATEISRIAERRAVQVVPVYGGAPMGRQIELLRAGGHVVSGTPGRVLDHLRRGTLHLNRIKVLVLDEADEMLSMGFLEDILEIIKRCPADRQTLLFSATMPDEVVRLAGRHQKSALMIQMSADYVGVAEVVHAYYMVTGMGRMRDLLRVLEVERPDSAVIFCNTREETSQVAEFMRSQGLDAEAISSDLSQADRERVMGRMKAKDLKYLVATDVAARGIDISDLSHVINYTFPESAEVYVHRTGRTGRAGKSGVAISLISPRELGNFYYLKLTYKIRAMTVPTTASPAKQAEPES